jgi:hypothetical protein
MEGFMAVQLSEIESDFLTRREAGAYLRSRFRQGSKAHLDLLAMTEGAGPRYIKNGNLALYTRADLDDWAAHRLTHAK